LFDWGFLEQVNKEGRMMKILIKDGLIVDGTGRPGFYSDLLINEGRVARIGQFPEEECERVISAKGQVVSPGFIDTHSHSDLEAFVDPYLEPKVRQGITTEIIGQDGVAAAPVDAGNIDCFKENLARITGDYQTVTWSWRTVDDYCRLLEAQGIGPNLLTLVPHGNIRMEVLGLNNRKPKPLELKQMKDVLKRDLQSGAAGLSTGLIYPPCSYADTQELVALCSVVAEYGKFLVVHQRSEADAILDSMREILGVARESGVKVHFSHFKICGRMNWAKLDLMEALLDQAREQGIAVSYDMYPYTAGSTTLSVALPPWALEGGIAAAIGRLKDTKTRLSMVRDIRNGLPGWDNLIKFAGFDGIIITSVRTALNQECIGKTLTEIAEIRGQDPFETVFDLLLTEELKVGMIDYYGNEEHIIRLLQRPEVNLCTDGLPGGRPHPRLYGAFPRVLGYFVRSLKALSLEEAIYKMTGKPAAVFQLSDRGVIKEGNRADLVIFNPETVTDTGTFTEPCRFPEGISQVLINGAVVLDNGKRGKELTGKVLRWI
jgi:N-acyl-D-amino-acid deacylase